MHALLAIISELQWRNTIVRTIDGLGYLSEIIIYRTVDQSISLDMPYPGRAKHMASGLQSSAAVCVVDKIYP